MAGVFSSFQQWHDLRTAWRERAASPLLQYYTLVRRRRYARLPWWRRRALVLLGVAGALAAVVVYFASGSPLYGLSPIQAVVWALALGLVFALMCWFVRSLFDTLVGASCLLSLPGRRKLDLQVDDELLASRYSAAELLVGLGLPLLRGMVGPVLGAAVVARMLPLVLEAWNTRAVMAQQAAVQLVSALTNGASPLEAIDRLLPGWVQELLLAPLSVAGQTLSGLLAVCALILLALSVGRRLRMDVQAGALAAIYAVGSLAWVGLSAVFSLPLAFAYRPQDYAQLQGRIGVWEPLPLLATLVVGVLALLGCLRRSAGQPLGLSVVYGLPLLFAVEFAGMIWRLGSSHVSVDFTNLIFDWLYAWNAFAPASAIAVPHPACLGSGFYHLLTHPAGVEFRWPVLVLAQVLLICGLLRQALDGIGAARRAEA